MEITTNNAGLRWTLLAVVAFSAECGAGQATALLREARVSRDSIRLSDLLPPQASPEMRRAGEQIELGRTPLCHTAHVFEAPDIAKHTASWPALRELTLSGPVSIQRACFPISRETVQRAISEFAQQNKLPWAHLPLHWTEVIYASEASPVLELQQVLPDPLRSVVQIRLRCIKRAICPSFWVALSTPQNFHILSVAPVSSAPVASMTGKTTALVKSGQRVMLIFDEPALRMQLPVTCLQRGALGDRIRALDSSTHRVFRAEVTSAETLMGHL